MRDRRKAERRGRGAELIAMIWLICKGYRILGRRLRTPYGEVDLAAWKRGVLTIIEVKARPSVRAGVEAVTPWQQQRLSNAALALARRWRLDAAPIRMDVLVVGPGFWPRHLRGAWFEDRSR